MDSVSKRESTGMNMVTNGEAGSVEQWIAYLLPDPAAPGLIPSVPKIFGEEKLSMLVWLINGAS